MEWKVEEKTEDFEILSLRIPITQDRNVEIRVMHDLKSNMYTLRLIKLVGFSHGEISLISSLSTRLRLSVDYSPSDKAVYLTPSPVEYVYTSLDKVVSRVREIVEIVRLVVSYVTDFRSSLEIAESILKRGWLVDYDSGRIGSVRKTFSTAGNTWLIVQIFSRDGYDIGKLLIKITCIGKKIDIVRRVVDLLVERGFKITNDMLDLGYAELEQEVYSIGLTDKVVDEVDKLISEVTTA